MEDDDINFIFSSVGVSRRLENDSRTHSSPGTWFSTVALEEESPSMDPYVYENRDLTVPSEKKKRAVFSKIFHDCMI